MRSTKLTAHLYPFATPHIHSHSEEGASFTGEQMRRVVDAAEAGVRDRMERKVLKAASMGYTRGVRQGEAQAKEEFVKEYPSRGGGLFDESNGTNADVSTRALAPEGTGDTKMNLNQSEELASLRNAVAATAGGSVAERDDAGSVFSEDSAVGTAVSASARDVEKNARKPPVPPGAAVHFPTRIPEEDSAKEHSDRETPSTPDKDASDAADDEPNAFSARSDGGSVATSIRPKGSMPTDAGRMPDEVFVGRRVVGGKGKTYGVKNTPRSENGEGGGALHGCLPGDRHGGDGENARADEVLGPHFKPMPAVLRARQAVARHAGVGGGALALAHHADDDAPPPRTSRAGARGASSRGASRRGRYGAPRQRRRRHEWRTR